VSDKGKDSAKDAKTADNKTAQKKEETKGSLQKKDSSKGPSS